MFNKKSTLFITFLLSILNLTLAENISPHGFNFSSQMSLVKRSTSMVDECSATVGDGSDGLLARFYRYVWPEDTMTFDDKYFLDKEYYSAGRYMDTVKGVNDVNFFHFYGMLTGVITNGELHGYPLTISNFSVEYTGWFVPKETGTYTFEIGQTDDATLLELYDSNNYLCCEGSSGYNFTLYSIQYYDNISIHTGKMDMIAGEAYPLKIVYFNRDAVAIQTISFTDPNGVVHNTFDGYVKYYEDLTCLHENDEIHSHSFSSSSIFPSIISTISGVSTNSEADLTVTDTLTSTLSSETEEGPSSQTHTVLTEIPKPPQEGSVITITEVSTLTDAGTAIISTVTEITTMQPEPSNTEITIPPITITAPGSVITTTVIYTTVVPANSSGSYNNSTVTDLEFPTVTSTIVSLITVEQTSTAIPESSPESLDSDTVQTDYISSQTTNEASLESTITTITVTTTEGGINLINPTTTVSNNVEENDESNDSNIRDKQSNKEPEKNPSRTEVVIVTVTESFENPTNSNGANSNEQSKVEDENNILLTPQYLTVDTNVPVNVPEDVADVTRRSTFAAVAQDSRTETVKEIPADKSTLTIYGSANTIDAVAVPTRRSTLVALAQDPTSHAILINVNAGNSVTFNDNVLIIMCFLIIQSVIA